MIIKTTPGKTYVVESDNGCTVKRQEASAAALTVEAGAQGYFVATAQEYEVSDDAARVVQVFKLAPQQRLALLGVLGGNAGGSVLPAGYKRLEYLESSGTQRLLLNNLTVTNEDVIEWKSDFVKRVGEADGIFSGATGDSQKLRCVYMEHMGRLIVQFLSEEVHPLFIKTIEGRMEKGRAVLNNETYSLSTGSTIMYGVYLFAQYVRSFYPSAMRLYYWNCSGKIKLIPALDPTGAPCMFDTVSKTAFYNKGTGDFLYPTERTTYSLRRVLPDWGKLTEHGLRRLYHAPDDWQGELIDYALEYGYKPIVESEKPEIGYWVPQWRETEEEIILEWVETEPPVDEFLTIPTEQ